MNVVQTRTRAKKITEKNLKIRSEHWPDLSEELLWQRNKQKGFITTPRTMPHIMQLMDEMAGKPLSPTYFALWCRSSDESIVIVNSPREIAFESKFTGQRAENTWKDRMKALVELGFIDAKPGPAGPYHYVLLLNPHEVIKNLIGSGKFSKTATYTAFFERILNIGADY